MDNKDWFDCGARIGDLVQSAIDSKNYQHLNESITDVINDTVEALQNSFFSGEKTGKKPEKDFRRDFEKEYGKTPYGEYRRGGKTAFDSARERANTGDLFETLSRGRSERSGTGKKSGRGLRGMFSMIAGYSLAAGLGITALVFGLLSAFVSGGFLFATILFTILAVISGILGSRGFSYRRKLRRAEQYMKIVGDRDFCTVEELAAGSGRTVKEVKKDLKEMISGDMFGRAAYLDAGETTLMVSHEAYRQYQEALKAQRQRENARENQAKERREAEKNMANLSDETRQILQEGREFIAHIHECNEKIPDETMTEKLTVLEQVVTRIFQQVEEKPESAPDLHRMMSYYLPITKKLIDAYVDLDSANLQGENVRKTRREIELSLDTINSAFETFLDSFFEDTAWDISSDITTLKTMMARDGLTGNQDFSGQRIREVGNDLTGSASAAAGGTAAAKGGGAAAAYEEERSM